MNIDEILSKQAQVINEQNQRIATVEFMLIQTMTLLFKNVSGADAILLEMQEALTKKIVNNGTISTVGHQGFNTAEHIFASIRESIDHANTYNHHHAVISVDR